jgi:hypothetical protein
METHTNSHRPAGATQINLDAFYERLTHEYHHRFAEDPEYAYAASRTEPETLARRMTLGIENGTATIAGSAIRATCRHFGIPHTYKAIRAFLLAQ